MSNTTLISKIAAASRKVGALKPDKRNEQQRYDYISADKILERAGDALAEAGVAIVPSITSELTEAVKTDKGGTRYDCVVHFGMIISDGESQLEMPWCGRGSDYSVPDKALYKAITSGHKYFLAKLLNIGVGNEDGEHETTEPAKAANPVDGDVLFEKPQPRASKKELEQLYAVAKDFYGDEWEEQLPKLCEWATTGQTSSPNDLLSVEVTKIIKGVQRKKAALMQSTGQPHPEDTRQAA